MGGLRTRVASFELLDHDAELGLSLQAAELPEIFAQAAKGLTACLSDLSTVQARETVRIEVTGSDLAELLVCWLKEWLYRYDTTGFLVKEVKILEISSTRIFGEGRGEVRVPGRHPAIREIKAITFHQALIEPTADGWRGQVIFDV